MKGTAINALAYFAIELITTVSVETDLKPFAVEEPVDGRTFADVRVTQKSGGQSRGRFLRD